MQERGIRIEQLWFHIITLFKTLHLKFKTASLTTLARMEQLSNDCVPFLQGVKFKNYCIASFFKEGKRFPTTETFRNNYD